MTPSRFPLARLASTMIALVMLAGPIVPSVAYARSALAPAQPGPPQPRVETSDAEAPVSPAVEREPVAAAQGTTSPVIHVLNERPDPERGVIKLARHINSAAARSGDVIHVTVNYEEQCTLPCGVAVDNSERPIFFFMRDGSPISKGFRIPSGSDTFTVKFNPGRRGMALAGAYLTVFLILPVGIPLWIAGKPKMWIAAGEPSDSNDFVRLKKAKV